MKLTKLTILFNLTISDRFITSKNKSVHRPSKIGTGLNHSIAQEAETQSIVDHPKPWLYFTK